MWRGRFYNSGRGHGRNDQRGGPARGKGRAPKRPKLKTELIPLVSKQSTDNSDPKVKVQRTPAGRGARPIKKEFKYWGDPQDKELMCRVIEHFLKEAPDIYPTDELKIRGFSKALGPPMDTEWDAIADRHLPHNDGTWETVLQEFIQEQLGSTCIQDQIDHLNSYTVKPFELPVRNLKTRINAIVNYMKRWPNNPNGCGNPPMSERDQKLLFEKLMLNRWRVEAIKAGVNASDLNMEWDALVNFYVSQARADDHAAAAARARTSQAPQASTQSRPRDRFRSQSRRTYGHCGSST